jgi:hypothetical protein
LPGGTLFYQSRVYPVPSQFNQSEPNVLVGAREHLQIDGGIVLCSSSAGLR